MKVLMSIARYLFIVSLPFLLLTAVIAGAVNWQLALYARV